LELDFSTTPRLPPTQTRRDPNMAADDDSSDLSSLSSLSPVPSDAELDDASDAEVQSPPKGSILKFFPKLSAKAPKEPSPPPRKREPSPPHEYVLADNPDIAFIVMFRNRFSDVFPKSLAHFGPQELERDVVEPIPGDRVEHFLCAILGLLLNRKQDVKYGTNFYTRRPCANGMQNLGQDTMAGPWKTP
jgi:hypothetical protein